MRLRHWFILLNIGLVASLAAAVFVDYDKDWRDYQKAYYRKSVQELEGKLGSAGPDERKKLEAEIASWKRRPLEIRQIIVNDLHRIDRCVTCHVGMDEFTNPTLANPFTVHPFKAHPDVSTLVKKHPFQKFGCTSCHDGQGLATDVEAAHGNVHFWETQVQKQPFIQGACAKCHAGFEEMKELQTAALGAQLFRRQGCIGCHAVNGEGGIISVDLGDIADKPVERIAASDFARAKMPAEHSKLAVKNWILAHLIRDPMQVVHNDPEGHFNAEPIAPSGMPPFHTVLEEGEAEAIATYLLSFSKRPLPKEYYVYAPPKPRLKPASGVERGRLVFERSGCAGCHGQGGAAGWRNFNALGPDQDSAKLESVEEMAKGREPTLVETVGTFTRDELREKIRNGVTLAAIVKFNPKGPTPPLYMPPWKDKIKGEELEDLITFLLSIAKKGEAW